MSLALRGRPAPAAPAKAFEAHEPIPLSLWFLIAGLAFNLLSGHADQVGLPINPDRFLLPAAMLLVLLERQQIRLPQARVLVVFALFATVATWSALGHDVQRDSVAAFALLDRVFLPLALCVAAPSLLASPRQRRVFLWFLTVVGLYLAFTTVAQFVGAWSLVWPPYARAPSDATGAYRAGGPFVSSEANGLSLVMCGFAAVALAKQVRGPAQLVPMIAVVACLATSLLSMTRSVWLAALLAGVAFLALSRGAWRGAGLVAVVLAIGAVTTVALAPDFADALVRRSTESSSVYDRGATNVAALKIMAEQPLTGVGWRQFVDVGWDWVRQGDTTPMAHTHIEVHNVFLARGAELGIPGALLFAACLWVGPLRATLLNRDIELAHWRAFSGAALAAWFAAALLSPTPYPFPNFLIWIAGGAMLSTAWPAANGLRWQRPIPLAQGMPDRQR